VNRNSLQKEESQLIYYEAVCKQTALISAEADTNNNNNNNDDDDDNNNNNNNSILYFNVLIQQLQEPITE
jgi:hypothetical protein